MRSGDCGKKGRKHCTSCRFFKPLCDKSYIIHSTPSQTFRCSLKFTCAFDSQIDIGNLYSLSTEDENQAIQAMR